jgi:hypothetical protein
MDAIIFYNVAEYCNYSSKLTIKRLDKQIKIEIWSSDGKDVQVKIKTYLSKNKAYKKYLEKIGEAILGGWNILNQFPQKETWETRESK